MNKRDLAKFQAGLKEVKESHARIRAVIAECNAIMDRYNAAGQPVDPAKRARKIL